MSLKSKCELVEVLQARYLKASKAEKKKCWTNLHWLRDIIGNMRQELTLPGYF